VRPSTRPSTAGRADATNGPQSLLGLVGVYLVGSSASEPWSRGDWLWVLELVSGVLAVLVGGAVALRWLRRRERVDRRLVQTKLNRDACVIEVRLAVIAPIFADSEAIQARLDRLVAAHRPFALATGNSLVPRAVQRAAQDLRILAPFNRPNLLNVRELARLWHLPQAADDISFLERTTTRRRLPLKSTGAPSTDGQAAVSASRRTSDSRCRCTCRRDSCADICWPWPNSARQVEPLLCLVLHLMHAT
jgi:hypothetical protein